MFEIVFRAVLQICNPSSDSTIKSSNGDIDEQYTTTNINTFYEYSQTDGKEFVRKQLGNSLITVELVNSEFDSQSNLTIYNNTPKSFIRKENYKTLIPVINDTNKNKAYIGILKITVFN